MNYTILHLHSQFSNGVTNIDSITEYREYVEAAKNMGMTAIAFTEHGSVFSWLHKKEAIEAAGMKYIHGIEAYVTETLEEKVRDNYHVILLAKNYDGVKEINSLSTASFNRNDNHFYYVPRISFEELINTSDNIIITSACLGGILNNGSDELQDRFINFMEAHKDRCFLEIQHHCDSEGRQAAYNKKLYEISKRTGIRLTVGTDTHALNDEHMEGRSILQRSKKVRFESEDEWDLVMRGYEYLIEAFTRQNALPIEVVRDALECTNVIADMVDEFKVNRSYKYPHLWENPETLLRQKIEEGFKNRGIDKYPNAQEYRDRVEYEMKAYVHNRAIDFMLLMEDIIAWCKTKDIQVGYGRGSVNGSIVAYLLGITEMDSIKYGLNFDRFMNIERVSLSDIDTDFPPSRINEVKDYIFSHHGLYCSDIITFNTIADRGAITDVGRALEMPLDEVKSICNMVDDEEKYRKVREEYPELFRYVDLVKGTIVSVGSHPCGTLVVGFPLDDTIGLFTTSTSAYPISQLNMKEVDSANFVKLDLLKLDTIELINETCKLAGIERLTPDNIDVNDERVWKAIRDDTVGIFQWEGSTGDQYIKKLMSDENIEKFRKVNPNMDRMTLFSIGNSAIRPAGASYRDDLANGIVRKTESPAIDDFLSDTFGYLVFQCQIISFLHLYCGFTMGEADVVRRGFAKKTGTDQYIPRIKQGFIETMTTKYGSTVEKAENDIVAFIKVIEDASNYLFSLNHSAPYSFEGYVSGYLREYYPLEFLTTALNINKNNADKTALLSRYANGRGIEIKKPIFRKARADYYYDKRENAIYKGIESLKYLNASVGEELYEIRDKKFETFTDLLLYIRLHMGINSRQLITLIKIGYFEEFGNINKLLHVYNAFDRGFDTTKKCFRKQIKKAKLTDYGIASDLVSAFSKKQTELTYMMVDMLGLLRAFEEVHFNDIPAFKRASYQQTILGKVDITDINASGICIVGEVNDKYTPRINGYSLKNGKYHEFKIPKTTYAHATLEEGDVIDIEDCAFHHKLIWVNGKKVELPDQKELWVSRYKIIFKSELKKSE